jgi:hypothetical protein
MNATVPAKKSPNTVIVMQSTGRRLAELFLMVFVFVMTGAAILFAAITSSASYVFTIVAGRQRPAKRGWKTGKAG